MNDGWDIDFWMEEAMDEDEDDDDAEMQEDAEE